MAEDIADDTESLWVMQVTVVSKIDDLRGSRRVSTYTQYLLLAFESRCDHLSLRGARVQTNTDSSMATLKATLDLFIIAQS